jgi:ABC-2 type transport system ATP-binding protein
MTSDVLTADSLCRSFGSTQALHNVSFSIPRGSVCSLLGPNGAGKTTLLKLLLGLIQPTSGSCSIAGDSGLPRSPSVLQSTGCLIDGFEPSRNTRIQNLISLNRDVSPKFDFERALKLLTQKGLAERMLWGSLSKGQQRWTLLVMLLCRGCDVLLLDEPADGLDPEARLQLYQLIRREANERDVTVLVTTHIINDIEKITDDVCILHQGRLILHESLEDLREQVFVVELEQPVQVSDCVQILRTETREETTYWLRDITGKLQGMTLSGEMRRRNVSLEEIYLAVTTEAAERIARSAQASALLEPS